MRLCINSSVFRVRHFVFYGTGKGYLLSSVHNNRVVRVLVILVEVNTHLLRAEEPGHERE